jgi:thiol-disulfide isomerase/thioredoxin
MVKKLGLFILLIVSIQAHAQSSLTYSSFVDLQTSLLNDKEHVIVLNFWATWCKPCVAELPDFEKLNTDFKDKGVKVVLANLDFHSQTPTTVPDFMQKRNISSSVVHITDQDPNDYINKADVSWSGAIPATVIYYKGEKIWFFEGQTDYETLKSIISKYIQQ